MCPMSGKLYVQSEILACPRQEFVLDVASLVSLIGVLGIGSIAGQYVAGGGQRLNLGENAADQR
jgi:hypothetical protein